MLYHRVYNDVEIETPQECPKSFGEISGFHLLSDEQKSVYGWVPYVSPVVVPSESEIINQTNMNIRALWQSAHDYEYEQISGSAIGLLAIGIIQAKPKCLAVEAWIQSIWTLYYQRKAVMTNVLPAGSLDFSSCGLMPYTVPEIMIEMGV